MEAIKHIEKMREYLNYLEEHINNVEWAWNELKDKCKHMRFIYDDYVYWEIDGLIKKHDLSKFSKEEFTQYCEKFFPVAGTEDHEFEFEGAWNHHKICNPHHWETWTAHKTDNPYYAEIHCVCMIIDWMAMGRKFGDTAKEYYEKNSERIILPEWTVKFINEIFDCVY